MQVIASWLLASILGFLSALHLYWAAGGRWASQTTIPRQANGDALFHPGAVATVGVAVLLLIGTLVVVMPLNHRLRMLLSLAIAGNFALRGLGDFHYVGFFKSVVDSPFAYWDTLLYSPLCPLVATLATIVSTSRPSGGSPSA